MSDEAKGKVYLVGAGPGDPELLTLKAARLLSEADAVVYDALVSSEVLSHISENVVTRYVGKREGCHSLPQAEINSLLAELAQTYKKVIRLKGGDPYLFGRGAEEERFLRDQGIDVEVVPGITSALAVPAAAGIPLTHRDHASAVVIATGHRRTDASHADSDWSALGALGATITVLMGVKNLQEIVDGLRQGGLPPETPAALVQWGTTHKQREVTATLETLVQRVDEERMGAPSVLVVGKVVSHRYPRRAETE